jgi:hypothetical protein
MSDLFDFLLASLILYVFFKGLNSASNKNHIGEIDNPSGVEPLNQDGGNNDD